MTTMRRYDEHTEIEAKTSTWNGRTQWHAREVVNGYSHSWFGHGDTEEKAVNMVANFIAERRSEQAAAEALEDAGVYGDLSIGHGGAYGDMNAALRATSGTCHFCGLDRASCDCR